MFVKDSHLGMGLEIRVLIHLFKGQFSMDHFVQGALVQEDFCPKRHWSKETFVQDRGVILNS